MKVIYTDQCRERLLLLDHSLIVEALRFCELHGLSLEIRN